MNEEFNICSVCDNRDSELYGISCMLRSRSKKLDGSDCVDFCPDEIYLEYLILKTVSEFIKAWYRTRE